MSKTKKSLLFSGLALMMSALLLAGTTFAWFTDSVTNKGNSITSGTLDVGISSEDPLFTGEGNFLWEPGRSQKGTVTVSNQGSLWLEYTMSFSNVVTDDTVDPEADITEVLDVYKVDGQTATAADLTDENKLGTVKDLMDQGYIGAESNVLAPNTSDKDSATDTFTLVIKMQEDAGNDYQGATVSFDIDVEATQTPSEEDGFGNPNYDENAEYADYNVTTADELKDALAKAEAGDVISLSGDMTVTDTITLDKAVTIDGNGATFKGSESGATANAFNIVSGADGVVIKNCKITNASNGVHIQPGAGDVTIDGCTFSGGKSALSTAVWVNGGNTGTITVKDSTFSRVINLSGVNNTVSNVVLENNSFNTGWSCNGVTICGSLENVTIRNNEFNQIGEPGIRVHEDGLNDFNLKNILIENNTFSSTSSTDISADAAVKDLWDAAVQNGNVVIK